MCSYDWFASYTRAQELNDDNEVTRRPEWSTPVLFIWSITFEVLYSLYLIDHATSCESTISILLVSQRIIKKQNNSFPINRSGMLGCVRKNGS